MFDLTLLFVVVISVLPVLALVAGKRMSGQESNEQIAHIREDSRILENKIIEVLASEGAIASKTQLASLKKKAIEYTTALESQKTVRADLEEKLGKTHADVIARESAHQDVKAGKQEDEVALQLVVARYNDISTESVSLERHLAESLKTIDKMTTEVSMTDDQKAVFEALTNALTTASAQLRDVIVAHQNVFERLEALRVQYNDLEAEYIKLVEMQLEA